MVVDRYRKENDHDIFERSVWTSFLMLIKKIIFLELVEKDKENATHVSLKQTILHMMKLSKYFDFSFKINR